MNNGVYLTTTQLIALRDALATVIKPVADEHGVTVKIGAVRHDSHVFYITLEGRPASTDRSS